MDDTGAPASPAHETPVKWTTPPLVLTRSPASIVTSGIHASQSAGTSSSAVRNPGAGAASGLMKTSRSPRASAAPRLQPAANPRFAPLSITRHAGQRSRTRAAVPSLDALSTTMTSSPSASSSSSGGSACSSASWLFQVTMTNEVFTSAPVSPQDRADAQRQHDDERDQHKPDEPLVPERAAEDGHPLDGDRDALGDRAV